MTPERWKRVGELFHESFDVPAEQLTAWLDQVSAGDAELRGELLSLLEADRAAAAGAVQGRVKQAVVSLYEEEARAAQPQRAGPYRIVRELGRGGMGTVYLAERDDEQYQTRVAIKLVRPGMDTDFILSRFRRERQILAHMHHPNIARLLDGGTTEEGLPYIVMEYIQGIPITSYCTSHGLGVDDRLKLFLDVCAAVECAHRNFVVHRDLKPGNILVDESGVPKLLDFGICKLLYADPMMASQTMTDAMRMLTPDYASPEQIRGDPITIASDIYSLGAVLYELLTGVRPHRFDGYSPQAIERAICEQDVIRPSVAAAKPLARRLVGDLDNILLRALQKDPQRRYETAEHFAEDVRRYLSHRPVEARADTFVYRTLKFTRRHRGGVLAVTAVVASLLTGIIISVRQAQIARRHLMEVRQLANTFVFDVHDAVRDLPGSTRARQLIVSTGLRYLDSLAKDSRGDRALQSELAAAYRRIGDVQGDALDANLGNTPAAIDSYRKSLALLDGVLGHDPGNRQALLDRLMVHHQIGNAYSYTRDIRQAIASLAEAKRLADEALTRYPGDDEVSHRAGAIYLASSSAQRTANDYQASLKDGTRGLELTRVYSASHPDDRTARYALAEADSMVGTSEATLGRLSDALGHYHQTVAQMEQLVQADPTNVTFQRELMIAWGHVGDVLGNPNLESLGDTAGSISAFQHTVDLARHLYEQDQADQRANADYGIALSRLATVIPEKEPARRLPLLRDSVKHLEEVARVSPQNLNNRLNLAHVYNVLGQTLAAAGDGAGAVRNYQASLTLSETMLQSGQSSPLVSLLESCRRLGEEAARRGDRDTALRYVRRAFDVSNPESAAARSRPPGTQKFMPARGCGAMGLVYAQLARLKNSDHSREDRQQAGVWLDKSLKAWRQLQSDPSFSRPHRMQMQEVEAALAALEHPR